MMHDSVRKWEIHQHREYHDFVSRLSWLSAVYVEFWLSRSRCYVKF